MIVYAATKTEFRQDVRNNLIAEHLLEIYKHQLGHNTIPAEIDSWKNPMMVMSNALEDETIPGDTGVSIEYKIPQTSKRIDIILSGSNEHNKTTANENLQCIAYDFKVFNDPNKLRTAITRKNKTSNKARMVAGYCWAWNSKKDPSQFDVIIEEHNFQMQWNLTQDGSLWIRSPASVNEIGCIHTCQGLEVDYIGVIIGPDLIGVNGTDLLICL